MTILPGRHVPGWNHVLSSLKWVWVHRLHQSAVLRPSGHKHFLLQFCCAVLCKKDVYKRNSCYSQHSFGQSARHQVKEAQFLKSIQAYNAIVLLLILDTELPLLYTTFTHVSAWIKLSGPVSDSCGQFARSAVVIIPFSGFFFQGQKCIGS